MNEQELYWFDWAQKNKGRTIIITEGDDYWGLHGRVGWYGVLMGFCVLLKNNNAYLVVDVSNYTANFDEHKHIKITGVNSEYIEFI